MLMQQLKAGLKKCLEVLGWMLGVGVIFSLGWLAGSFYDLFSHLKRSKYVAAMLSDAPMPRVTAPAKLHQRNNLTIAKPISVQKIELLKDATNNCYWLEFTVDRIPKLYVYSDLEHPYGIKLFNTFIKNSVMFNNLTASPIKALSWKPVKNHLEFSLSLNKGYEVILVNSKVINARDGDEVALKAKAKALKQPVDATKKLHETKLRFKIVQATKPVQGHYIKEMLIDESESEFFFQSL